MRTSARAIIFIDGKLLTMFRRKRKDNIVKEYYVIPGGGQNEGEALENTVKRELNEEMELNIEVGGFLGKRETAETEEYYFFCKVKSGVPKLSGEELERMTEDNFYEPRLVDIQDLDKIDISGKDFINKALQLN